MPIEKISYFALGILIVIVFRAIDGKINKPKKRKTTRKPRVAKRFCHDCGHVHSIPDNQPRNG